MRARLRLSHPPARRLSERSRGEEHSLTGAPVPFVAPAPRVVSVIPHTRENEMKKMRLDPDALAVASFPTAPEPAGRGTVAANEATSFGQLTCATSCGGGGHCTCIPARRPGDPRP